MPRLFVKASPPLRAPAPPPRGAYARSEQLASWGGAYTRPTAFEAACAFAGGVLLCRVGQVKGWPLRGTVGCYMVATNDRIKLPLVGCIVG